MSKLTSQKQNFPKWYQEVVERTELAEHSPVKGAMTIRPYGYGLWENIQQALDNMIKETGVQNAYFPLFVPKSFIEKESKHVEGFAPELAWVTKGGGKDLEEPYAIRPTSETVIGEAFSRWIQSYRDLPLLINQWANVVRWEMRPRLFLRTTEFLWQEGHTAHASKEDAWQETKRALDMYKTFMTDYLAMHVIDGYKSEAERFAGAEETTCVESLMRDNKALQMGTSHYLGQNFAKVFEIAYLDDKGETQLAHTTSWGVSTRLIGGVIMAHGNDKGLIMPPKVAPIQTVIIPIGKDGKISADFKSYITKLEQELAGLRVSVDWDDQKSPGWKFNEWELKGVPIRLEVGEREASEGVVMVVRRDSGDKEILKLSRLKASLDKILDSVHTSILQEHRKFTESHTNEAVDYEAFKTALSEKPGFISTSWCGSDECEQQVKQDTSATIRVIPFEQGDIENCVVCGQQGTKQILWAKAY